jgi:hypothetical protein
MLPVPPKTPVAVANSIPLPKFVPFLRFLEKTRTSATGRRPIVERICTVSGATSFVNTVETKPQTPNITIEAKL